MWNTYFLPGATIIDKRTVNYGINDKCPGWLRFMKEDGFGNPKLWVLPVERCLWLGLLEALRHALHSLL